jgi:hypothetical protein
MGCIGTAEISRSVKSGLRGPGQPDCPMFILEPQLLGLHFRQAILQRRGLVSDVDL